METAHKQIIQELVDLLHKNKLSEIEYEISGLHLRLVGAGCSKAPVVAEVKPEPVVIAKSKKNTINSPMVGIVYLSSDPEKAPFVKVGDSVSVGQVVCQIEAMKTFNPIKADKAGKITQILVESGNPVEYNQPLFVVE